MRSSRHLFIVLLLASLLCSLPLVHMSAKSSEQPNAPRIGGGVTESWGLRPALIDAYHGAEAAEFMVVGSSSEVGGIKEDVADKFKARYQRWKDVFLSTDTGKQQWATYSHNNNLTLTITMTDDNSNGASTGKYKWDSSGQLVAATITLGTHIDEGFPNPIYYPVMNSLSLPEQYRKIDQDILAATKIAHEFGHVNRTTKIDAAVYQRQIQLIPVYNKIFLSNGRNITDPKLVDLAKQLGGTPVEIWEDREYWGETNAMLYIRDKFTDDGLRCSVFSRIKRSLDLYAKGYEGRFFDIVQSTPQSNRCRWE